MNSHTALGIAQIVFYVPVVPLAIWLMIRNGSMRPRMAWWPMIPFSLMRLAGGPVIIVLEKHPTNLGLIITAIVLLNVGAIPLIVAASGLTRIVLLDNYPPTATSNRFAGLLRLAMIGAIGLLAAGGGLNGVDGKRDLARILALAGYALFAAILLVLIATQLYLWRRKSSYLPSSQKVLLGVLLAEPFLLVRSIYGILQVTFEFTSGTVWNPVYGSAVAFALMALVTEYIAMGIFFWVGFSIPPDRGVSRLRDSEDIDAQKP